MLSQLRGKVGDVDGVVGLHRRVIRRFLSLLDLGLLNLRLLFVHGDDLSHTNAKERERARMHGHAWAEMIRYSLKCVHGAPATRPTRRYGRALQ